MHDRIPDVTDDIVTTLYTPDELKGWKDYNSLPAYIKSSHQKLINSFCVLKDCALESRNMLGQVFNLNGSNEGVQLRGTAMLNELNPFG